jgi:UDP-N-acetyl-D-glucosamine dehydrogenase
MPDIFADLRQRIERRDAIVGVIGLGYVGLPLARAFSRRGFRVLGFDTDRAKVDRLCAGDSYIGHIPAEDIREMLGAGFRPTADLGLLGEPNALLICVPTPLTAAREPDLSFVCESTEAIARTLRPGQIVVLESTSYPGTTRQVILPILQRSGVDVGTDAFIAYSPEREDPCPVGRSTRSTAFPKSSVAWVRSTLNSLAHSTATSPVASCPCRAWRSRRQVSCWRTLTAQ